MVQYRDSINYRDPNYNYRGGPVVGDEVTSIRLYNENATYICEIPDVENLSFKESKNQESAWSFDYPLAGINFANMISEKDRTFSVRLPGGGLYWGYLEDDGWEEVDKQDGKATFSGRGTEGLLDYARVYPTYPLTNTSQPASTYYANVSVGFIFRLLWSKAFARGAIPSIKVNFTNTLDSSGTPWSVTSREITIPAGLTYLELLKSLSAQGWFDWRMTGHTLEMFEPDSPTGMMKDRTNVIFRRGIHIQKAPRARSRKDLATSMLGIGDGNLMVESTDSTAIAARGRKEGAVSQSGVNIAAMLGFVTSVQLKISKEIRLAKNLTVAWKSLRPFTDFRVGDYVYADISDAGVEKYRVVEYSYTVDTFNPTGQLALNDKFAEASVRLQNALDKLGSVGATGGQPATPGNDTDTGTPNAPIGLSFTTDIYSGAGGLNKAIIFPTWSPVTTNTNGSVASDINVYAVQYKYASDANWISVPYTDITSTAIGELIPNKSVSVRVRVQDTTNHWSAYSAIYTANTSADTTPPSIPKAPTLTSRLGQAVVAWDGTTYVGSAMESDFDHANVYYSQIFEAPIGTSVLAGRLGGPGTVVVSDLAYGQDYYFRMSAVDTSGNESELTDPVKVTINAVVGPDLTANSVTTNALDVGAVTAIKIKVNEVSADRVSFGATTNMVPDPSFGDSATRTVRDAGADVPARWQFSNFSGGLLTPDSGYYLEAFGHATDLTAGWMPLTGWFGVHPYEKYYLKSWVRNWSAPADAQFYIGLRVLRNDGTVLHRGGAGTPIDGSWRRYWLTAQMQPGDVQAMFVVTTFNHSIGSYFFDEVEVRNYTNTAVGSGSTMDLSPLGIVAKDFNENIVFSLDAETGDILTRGTIISGVGGKRLELNPGTTYLPEIRFYPATGNLFAYINASDTGSFPFIGVNAPDTGAMSQTLILGDNGFKLGEFIKVSGVLGGAGIESNGTGQSAEISLKGKLTATGGSLDTFDCYRFNVGTGGGANNFTIVLTKQPAPSSGLVMPLVTIQRAGTTQPISVHIIANSTASSSVYVQTTNAAAFTTVNIYVNYLFIRSNGDV